MIRFSLICEREHEFEAWFRSGDDFETQNGVTQRSSSTANACIATKPTPSPVQWPRAASAWNHG